MVNFKPQLEQLEQRFLCSTLAATEPEQKPVLISIEQYKSSEPPPVNWMHFPNNINNSFYKRRPDNLRLDEDGTLSFGLDQHGCFSLWW